MKLDHRDAPFHRGGSSDGGGGGGGVNVQNVPHSDLPTNNNRHNSHQEEVENREAGDMMASKLSHLDGMANWKEVWNPRLSMSLTSTKGLMNAPGDNNCFLNSAVQVLWHLDVFRRSFRLLSGHACMGNSCIFCALKVLFTQFQYSDRSTLPPNALRKALATSFQNQHRFQLGHMDDAAECFENILTRIHFHIANTEVEDKCQARHCIPHVKFAMNIVEQIVCQCGATTEPLPFNQMVHYVSASALVSQAKAFYAQQSDTQMLPNIADIFAQLLRNAAAEGDIRPCPSKCGEKVQIRRSLVNCPDVVSIGLIWDSDRPTLDHIKDVVRSIGTVIKLPDLFHSVSESPRVHSTALQLVGVVCYYGKHYSTFFFHSKMKKWVYFDDAHVKEMGPDWNNVADKCCRGHYQPLLLLYTNQNCEPIDTQTAPDVTTRLPGYQHFNSNTSPDDRSRSRTRAHNGETDGQSQYMNYEASHRQQPNNRHRRSMTPGPDQRDLDGQTSIPRRATTPGPEWGRYNSGDEDETDGPNGAVHFRQSSYLQALDAVPGEKVHRSKTATHGGDPYYNAQRDNYSQQINGAPPVPPPQSAKPMKPGNQAVTNDDRYREERQPSSSSYTQSNIAQGQTTNGKNQSQSFPAYSNGGPYQYVKPQTHPPIAQKPKPVSEATAKKQPPAVPAKPSLDYQDWTLSTSEPYRRQNMPKSPVKETGFVYPTAPAKVKPASNMAKVNEIHRLESFKKGKGKLGVDVVRYQVQSGKIDGSNNPYGPLEPEALYPGNEIGVMQTGNKVGQMPNSQSHPALKSELVNQNNNMFQSNLKRTRSLENTVQPDPLPVTNTIQTGNKLRPQSARPFENTNSNYNAAPPTTPKLKRPSNVHQARDVQNTDARSRTGPESSMDMVDRKPPRPSSRGPGYKDWKDEEDPYGTLSYINRKAVETILFQQHKSGAVNNRVRTLSQGPGSVGSRSSNSSLESCTEQLNRGTVSQNLPQRPALPEALRVEIPGDNLSLGSQKDSGYRSGGSGDRNSASSMSSASVDSPVTDSGRPSHSQYQQGIQSHHVQQGIQGHHHLQQVQQDNHPTHPYQQTVYASTDAKSHSSTDSLSSGQSGQSYATIKASSQSSIQQHISGNNQQQQHQMQQQRQQQLQRQPQQPPKQSYPHAQILTQQSRPVNQVQPVKDRGQNEQVKGQRPTVAGDECDSICFQAESMMEESIQKEKESDFHPAMILCQKAIGCLQQVMNHPHAGSETKTYARMKYNTCLLRSRSLHRRIIMTQEGSDLSAEDHTSVSSQSTDTDIKDVTDSPQHYYPPHLHHPQIPSNLSYEQQYSSDSGYSSHSVEISRQSQMPHSNTDGALAKHSSLEGQQKIELNWRGSRQNQVDNRGESDNKSIEIYATLPRKKSPKNKPGLTQALKQDPYKETEVYQSYLERQKAAANQDRQQRGKGQYERSVSQGDYTQEGQHLNMYPPTQQQYGPPPPPQSQQVYHARQTSNSKMNKEQIKQLLINDFLTRKEGKGKEERPGPGGVPEQAKHEHERIRNMLYNELTPQIKSMGIKDSKRAQSELNLHQLEPPEYGYQGYPSQQQDRLAMGYMVHPDSRQAQTLQSHHSRESSCSSTTTIKGHSRENSISSPPLSPKQLNNQYQHTVIQTNNNAYVYPSQQQSQQQQQQQIYQQHPQHPQQQRQQQNYGSHQHPQQQRHMEQPQTTQGHRGGAHPEYSQSKTPLSPYAGRREISAPSLDRDRHPPTPSMIGKLDKMSLHQQQQQQPQQQQPNPAWAQHATENGWPPHGVPVNKPTIRKSTSHQQIYEHGQADWTARSEGDVPDALTLAQQGPETNATCSTDLDESFPPPPPPDLFQYEEGEENFPPPPPPELLETYYQPAQPLAANQATWHQSVNQDPRHIHPANQAQGDNTLPPCGGSDEGSPGTIHTSVSDMVANLEQGSNSSSPNKKNTGKIKMRTHRSKPTFSTFFAPPQNQEGSGDRSSLSSVDSGQAQGLVMGRTKGIESDSSSCQNVSISSKSNTDSDVNPQTMSPPKRPKSALKKKREGRPRRKSVSFSDNVALVVDQEEMTESQGIDYIQYVSKVLEQSKNRLVPGSADSQGQDNMVPGQSPDSAPTLANGYDSDFDEDTASSASSSNGDSDQIRCGLCSKKVVVANEVYCVNCKFYMSRFQPNEASS